ncbi:MAG: redox-sensing transcriptional repressor Rex [Candidatus Omnitrophica bacterium]|nr:redox-sensing transcriptional repressor Rex [Candidatus Omnitrophota bacterium]
MPKHTIPQTTIYRLSLYLRALERLEKEGKEYISSFVLSVKTGISSHQIRRDLSYFGKFGKSRLGYRTNILVKNIRKILGIDTHRWKVALIGAGNLGRALFSYRGFRERGFFIKAVFDADPRKIGKKLNGIKIENIKNLINSAKEEKFDIAILAVPADYAQETAEKAVKAGIKAILNFAPVRINLSSAIILRNVDLSMELENLSFHLSKLK